MRSISDLAEEILGNSTSVKAVGAPKPNSLFIDEGEDMPDISKIKNLYTKPQNILEKPEIEESLQEIVNSLKIIAEKLEEITSCGAIGVNFSNKKSSNKISKKKKILNRLKKYGSL